jgi:multicomponent Na+:H+ antiporter subunit A
MLARALPEAFGRNVVNVILVDFRALDTLGEITVVAAAAVAVWSLLATRGGGDAEANVTGWIPLRVVARPVTLLLVATSVVVLLRGHNEPGGGFIGGLMAASGFLVYALAFGCPAASRLLRCSPIHLMGAGLLLAMASGLVALLRGQAYLTGQWWGQLLELGKAGTVLLFDVGVYLVVLGAAVLMLVRLLDPSCARGRSTGEAPR